MSEITLFHFGSKEIRYVGDGVHHEWVASDVVAALHPKSDPRNFSNYLKCVADKRKGHKEVMTPGGNQEVKTLLESGLYELLGKSKGEVAELFQDWLYETVLPSIRETGEYSELKPGMVKTPVPLSEIRESTEYHRWLYGDAYAQSYGRIMIQRHKPYLLGPEVPAKERASLKSAEAMMTPTEIAEALGITCKTTPSPDPRAVNRLLRDLGYQEKIEGKSGWSATEKGDSYSQRMPVSTGSRSDKDQLFWFASILDVLRDVLTEDAAA